MYIDDNSQTQATYQELRDNNPNVSLPANGTPILMFVWFYVYATAKPYYDPLTEELEAGAPIKTEGLYYQTWSIIPLDQQEQDDHQAAKDVQVQLDMEREGQAMTLDNNARIIVGSPAIITDQTAHDNWMQTVYAGNIAKPPADERQQYQIFGEDANPFTFTRYHDSWGWRWKMELTSPDVTNLALYIQDSNGNYLYTTGALIADGDNQWMTECPAGQADATPEDVYFHWILGAGRISSDFVYAGEDEALSGTVRFDTEYDM